MAAETLTHPDALWRLIARHARFAGLIPGQTLPLPLKAKDAYPRFDNCALDGYAVRAADLAKAAPSAPVLLTVIADQFAGQRRAQRLKAGQAVQIATGAPLPLGADTVVPYELCRRQGSRVSFIRAARPGANVRRRAEDVRKGERLAPKGARFSPALQGLAAACGSAQPLLRVHCLVSGDELADGRARGGQIYDANGPLLQGLLAQAGLPGPAPQRLPDRLPQAVAALHGALDADLLIVAGGMSVGKRDVLKPALERLGVQRLAWGIAQKPGKPLYLGRKGRTLVLGLPGNPAAVLTCFHAYALPILRGLSGRKAAPAWVPVRLAQGLDAPGSKALYLKASIGRSGSVRVLGGQGSHQLRSLADGNALIYLPPNSSARRRGDRVQCLRLDSREA